MKFPNQEYKMVLRRGTFLDKEALRREHSAAPIVFFCLAASAMVILAVALQSCAAPMAGGVR